jgi:hypothetical protein
MGEQIIRLVLACGVALYAEGKAGPAEACGEGHAANVEGIDPRGGLCRDGGLLRDTAVTFRSSIRANAEVPSSLRPMPTPSRDLSTKVNAIAAISRSIRSPL